MTILIGSFIDSRARYGFQSAAGSAPNADGAVQPSPSIQHEMPSMLTCVHSLDVNSQLFCLGGFLVLTIVITFP